MEKQRKIEVADPYEFGYGPKVMQEIKVCGHCGNAERAEKYTCSKCGNRLPIQTLFQIYQNKHKTCAMCDTVLASYMRYCPHCGMPLKHE